MQNSNDTSIFWSLIQASGVIILLILIISVLYKSEFNPTLKKKNDIQKSINLNTYEYR